MTNTNQWKKIFCLDTNILLDNANNLLTLSQEGNNLIVIPETVLDEIDNKKSGFDEINFQAREFGRLLIDASIDNKRQEGSITIVETHVGKVVIYIISKESYRADSDNVAPSIKNDRKILEIIKEFKAINGFDNAVFLSLDVMARTRAISLDIPCESLNLGNKELTFEFTKHLKVDDFPKENTPIIVIDKEHKPENFSYVFENRTEGYSKLAVIKNGIIEYINENELKKQDVNPMNTEQKFFAHSMLDSNYHIVLAEAKAGSGKSLLAVSAAMKLVKERENEFSRIVYIRNSIESLQKGEDVGYLSGNEEKFRIYNFPLFDTLAYIANKQLKASRENKSGASKEVITEELISERVQDLVDRYQIETMWTGAMRGRTLSNAFVIVDEAQNMSAATMQLVLSRIDASCKIVIVGSNRQLDNQYITKYTNGLTMLLNSCRQTHEEVNLFAVELQKVLRGPITAFAEKIFSKD